MARYGGLTVQAHLTSMLSLPAASNVYDPSGPLLTDDGTWHTWEGAHRYSPDS